MKEICIDATCSHSEACYQLGAFYYHNDELDNAIENLATAIDMMLQLVDITNDTLDCKTLEHYRHYLGQFAGIAPLQRRSKFSKCS